MTAAVQRIVRTRLPEDLAVGVLAMATGSLATDPRGSGEPLRRQLDGLWAAEREEYVLHYEIDDADHVVVIVGILPKPGSRLF
jgi:mRNA interferase RelE/StbE